MKKKRFFISIDKKVVCKYFNQEDGEKWLSEMREILSDKPLENETWVSIPNFSLYEASNLGRIRSLNYKRSGVVKVIQPSIGKDGYTQSMFLSDNGKYCTFKIHRLIALAFYGIRPENTEINHIDGNKQNNAIKNLEYITHSENCKHSFNIGLQKAKRGELNGMSKLTQEQVDYARRVKNESTKRYWGRKAIAKELGITEKHLQYIVNKDYTW